MAGEGLEDVERGRKVSGRTRTENWTGHEIQALVFAKRAQVERWEGKGVMYQGTQERWKEVVGEMEREWKVMSRSEKQCREKWEGLQKEFKRIREYVLGGGGMDYWSMSHVEKREMKLPVFFDRVAYDCMEKFQGKRYVHMCNNGGKKGMLGSRTRTVNWTCHEIQALVYAKKAQWEALSGKASSTTRFQGQQDRWKDVVSHMESEAQVKSRTVEQSRGKWEGLQKEFKRIKEYLMSPAARDYWTMLHAERRQLKLPVYFDRVAYDCMEEFHGKRFGQLSGMPTEQLFDANNRGSMSSNVSPHSPHDSSSQQQQQQPQPPDRDRDMDMAIAIHGSKMQQTYCHHHHMVRRDIHDPEPVATMETPPMPLIKDNTSSQTSRQQQQQQQPSASNSGKKRKAPPPPPPVSMEPLVRLVKESNMSLVNAIVSGNHKRDEHRSRMLVYEERKLEQRQALIDMENVKLAAEKERDARANENMENLVSVLGTLVSVIGSLAKKDQA